MTTVHILGTGTPTPTPERFGSAFAVTIGRLDVPDDVIMIDCGPAATAKLVKAGLWPTDVSTLFLTHHHFDHNVDLPCLLLTRWDQSIGAESVLRVRGPQPTTWVVDRLIGSEGAFHHDWRARVGAPVSQRVYRNRGGTTLPRPAPRVDVADIAAGDVVRADHWTMRTGHARHVQPWLDSIAYRLDTADGSVVFTGDTEPCAEIVELASGASLMLCMCWDSQSAMDECGEASGQCGTLGAARMAAEAGVQRLVLVHTGAAVSGAVERADAVEDVHAVFDGDVIFADELSTIEL